MRDSVFFNKNLPKKLAVKKPIIINKIIKIIKPRPGTSLEDSSWDLYNKVLKGLLIYQKI